MCVFFFLFSDIELSDGTDCVVFSQCDMPNGAFPLMEELRRQGHLIDVTILVGKTQRSIDAHKLVLASTVSATYSKANKAFVWTEKELNFRLRHAWVIELLWIRNLWIF